MSDFGEVRGLLHDAEPSLEAFERLIALFRQAEDRVEAERLWLPYALEHLEAWPDAARAQTLSEEAVVDLDHFRWIPLGRELTLAYQSTKRLRDLVDSPLFAGLRSFTLEQDSAPDMMLHWIAWSPHTQALEALSIHGVKSEGGVRALAESGLRLKSLDLFDSSVGSAGLAALSASPMIETLEVLALASCEVGDEGLRALAPVSYTHLTLPTIYSV